MFSEDKEKEIGQAEGAKAFLAAIHQADALVVSFAEHNGHHPAAYKNLFDWATRIEREVFKGIPAVYLATSPGPGGASNVKKNRKRVKTTREKKELKNKGKARERGKEKKCKRK
eukprot:TRINITY_DN14037_c0_g1_i3.p1 TRINITY_DN14037_c0_g1~~TRINITY_DN14037_c0_g1_i3.p1  ORF type:complete len:114 (-),score=11.82 TRINITY_DN14037_c0_g1_i3:34-375(-)